MISCFSEMNVTLARFLDSAAIYSLNINASKSQAMDVSRKKFFAPPWMFSGDGVIKYCVTTTLWFFVDSKLATWQPHVDKICRVAWRQLKFCFNACVCNVFSLAKYD